MTRHSAPDAATLATMTPECVLTVPLWNESHEYNPTQLRTPTRSIRVPVILWPDLNPLGAVVRWPGYYATDTYIVLREWNPQVLLHELLHVILCYVIPDDEDGTGAHDIIGAVEVALAPLVTFPTAKQCGCLALPENADLPQHTSAQHTEVTMRTRMGDEYVDALFQAHGYTP